MTQTDIHNPSRRPGRHAPPAACRLQVTPVAAAALLVLSGGLAQAQQTSTPGVTDTVIVTGIRKSIETSVATKRESNSIVEAISAEDLGKLPDTSIAESLARLPGLTAQRVEGRDQVISIRGLAPKFGVTLLNGREMVSTGDNRSVEYDQFPSELMNAATVYKTPDAALGAQGLAGTVNLLTVRPLDTRGRQANINVRLEKNSNGGLVTGGTGGKGKRLSLSYVDQFADNTIGVALGYARLDSPNQQKYFKSWWWGNTAVWGGGFPGLDDKTSSLQGFDTGVIATKSVRDGVMAVLEYKPNKNFRSQLDLYYSKFEQTAHGRELQSNLGPESWDGAGIGARYTNPVTEVIGGDQVLVGGRLSNVDPFVLMRYNRRSDKVSALGWNNELKFGDWTAAADVSLSKAKRDETVAELTASATQLGGFNFRAEPREGFSSFTPTLNYGSASVVQLRGISAWGDLNGEGSAGSLSPIKVDDEMKGLRLSAKRSLDVGPLAGVQGGLNYTDRSKDTVRTQTIYALKNGVDCIRAGDTCAPIPSAVLQSPTDLGFSGTSALISFNVPDAMASGAYNSGPVNVSSAPGRIWGVGEKIATLYAKADLDFSIGIPVRGNVGLQVVRAKQDSSGVAWDSVKSQAVPMSFDKSYTDTLPSLNLAAEITKTTYLRLGAAKVLARPNLEDMRSGFSASVATSGASLGKWSGSGGNPFLEPWRANAYDVSIEQYLGKRSYVSAAVFQKKLKNSIYVETFDFDFGGFPNSTGVTPVSNIGTLTAPVNGKGGKIKGLELAAALDGGLITPALDGLGIIASYSDTDSNLPGTANNGQRSPDRSLEGLSGKVTSLVAYYEKNGFQVRWAQRYRSAFVASVRGVWIDNSLAAIEAERITDLQLGYSFESGAMKGLSVLFQVNNLNDTPYRTSLADDSSTSTPLRMMPERYYTYGRKYLLGVSYKL